MTISIIVAQAENRVIGKDNELIWYIPDDLKRFKQLTTGHHIIMGRKTYEPIGHPLPNRTTLIITRQKDYQAKGCLIVHSLDDAIKLAKDDKEAFIIGGSQIYQLALEKADKLYLTQIHKDFAGDCFFPKIADDNWEKICELRKLCPKSNLEYSYIDYQRK